MTRTIAACLVTVKNDFSLSHARKCSPESRVASRKNVLEMRTLPQLGEVLETGGEAMRELDSALPSDVG